MKAKQILAAIIASTMIGCVTIQTQAVKKPAENEIVATDLTGIVYKLTKEEGLRQLKGLANDSKYEDTWYFLPETKEWVDYGRDISILSCNPEMAMLTALRPDIKEAYSYHIHTLVYLRMSGFSKTERKNFHGVVPPSTDDVKYWLEEKNYLKKFGISITETGVVDFGGYWQVNLETSDLEKLGKSLEKYETLVDNHITKYYSTYKSNKEDKNKFDAEKKQLIKLFEKDAAELGLDIKYNLIE